MSKRRHYPRHGRAATRRRWFNYAPMALTGLLTGVLISAGVWAWQRLSDPHTLPFHEVRIQGQFQHLDAAQLQHIAKQSINGGFFSLNMAAVKHHLMQIPWVESVAIRRVPGTLNIQVYEQQPIARWNNQYLVNSNQQLFAAPPDAPENLPVLVGPADQQQTVLLYFLQMSDMLKPLNLKINRLQLSERRSWELTLDNGVIVTLGREDVLPKMLKLTQWYPQIVGAKAADAVSIDLRYQNSVAVAWRGKNS